MGRRKGRQAAGGLVGGVSGRGGGVRRGGGEGRYWKGGGGGEKGVRCEGKGMGWEGGRGEEGREVGAGLTGNDRETRLNVGPLDEIGNVPRDVGGGEVGFDLDDEADDGDDADAVFPRDINTSVTEAMRTKKSREREQGAKLGRGGHTKD